MSDCGLLSCALIERVNKGRKPPKRGMAGRETRIPKGLVPHRRSGIHRGFSYIAHNRRNVRFKGLWRAHTPPHPPNAHTAAHTRKQGVFQMVGAITTLGARCAVWNLCARRGQKSILCHLCMDRGNVGEKQRAFGTETRTVRVSVPRRRGPAGSRCSTAVSCAAPVSFAVRYHCDEGQRGKFVNVTVVILFVV